MFLLVADLLLSSIFYHTHTPINPSCRVAYVVRKETFFRHSTHHVRSSMHSCERVGVCACVCVCVSVFHPHLTAICSALLWLIMLLCSWFCAYYFSSSSFNLFVFFLLFLKLSYFFLCVFVCCGCFFYHNRRGKGEAKKCVLVCGFIFFYVPCIHVRDEDVSLGVF